MFKALYDLIVLIIIGMLIHQDNTIYKDVSLGWDFIIFKYVLVLVVLLGIRRIVFGKWIR